MTGVNHQPLIVRLIHQMLQQRPPEPLVPPATEPTMGSFPVSIVRRHITPGSAGAQNPARPHYVDGDVHTNTIEGVWSHLTRAWFGQHHHYTKPDRPLYIAEACWKYNRRKHSDGFGAFLNAAME